MFPTVFISFHMLSYAREADLDPLLLQVLSWILERAWAIFLAQPTIYLLKLLHILSIFPNVPLYKALFLVLLLPLPLLLAISMSEGEEQGEDDEEEDEEEEEVEEQEEDGGPFNED